MRPSDRKPSAAASPVPPEPTTPSVRRVLLTGASGFVGSYLHPALITGGYEARCGTRHPERARKRAPDKEWVELDLDRPDGLAPALEGCDAAFYLVQGGGEAEGTPERETERAHAFREAAREAGLRRVVYVGCMEPQGEPSAYLQGRLEAGRILREGAVSTVELRASVILGAGSASWTMLTDLATRLPAMLLPRWLRHRTWPVAIDDVVVASMVALGLPDDAVGCYDVPGPEGLSHRLVLERTAAQLGAHPPIWQLPGRTPRLSSYWIALVTRLSLRRARQVVGGLQHDIDPSCHLIWERIPAHRRTPLEEGSGHALLDARERRGLSKRAREAMEDIGRRFGREPAPADRAHGP